MKNALRFPPPFQNLQTILYIQVPADFLPQRESRIFPLICAQLFFYKFKLSSSYSGWVEDSTLILLPLLYFIPAWLNENIKYFCKWLELYRQKQMALKSFVDVKMWKSFSQRPLELKSWKPKANSIPSISVISLMVKYIYHAEKLKKTKCCVKTIQKHPLHPLHLFAPCKPTNVQSTFLKRMWGEKKTTMEL